MKKIVIYFLLLLNIMAADSTWLFPFLLPSILLIFPMSFIGLGEHKYNLRKNKTWVYPFLYLCIYIFVVDLCRGEDEFYVTIYILLNNILAILTVLYLKEKKDYITWYITVFALLNLGVQLIQMTGTRVTGGTLLAPFGFIEYAETELFDSTRGFRYTGLYTNLVALACFSGIITAFFWILYNYTKKLKHLIFSLCGLLIAILTNTRAVIYFVLPAILIAEFLVKKKISRKEIILCTAFMVGLSLLKVISGYSSSDSSMSLSNLREDAGVIDRLQGNVFGTIGTLELNPLFGVSVEDQGIAIEKGYQKVGLFLGDYFFNHVTFHNLPLFYLRVYGIIGFLLFIYAYWSALKYAYKQKDPYDRQYLLTVLIFFFVYNLSHNMKITSLLFLFAVCASYKSYRLCKRKVRSI